MPIYRQRIEILIEFGQTWFVVRDSGRRGQHLQFATFVDACRFLRVF